MDLVANTRLRRAELVSAHRKHRNIAAVPVPGHSGAAGLVLCSALCYGATHTAHHCAYLGLSVSVRNPGSWVVGRGSWSWVLGHLTQKTCPDPGPMTEGRFSLSASAIVTCLGLLWCTEVACLPMALAFEARSLPASALPGSQLLNCRAPHHNLRVASF